MIMLFAEEKSPPGGAFVHFVTLGDPGPEQSLKIIDALIKVVPMPTGWVFRSDPLADGPTIQNATLRAFAAGVTPAQCFEMLAAIRRGSIRPSNWPADATPTSSLAVSIDEFLRPVRPRGVDSVLVADVPVESPPRSAGGDAP